jgi:MoxR-like ATPase
MSATRRGRGLQRQRQLRPIGLTCPVLPASPPELAAQLAGQGYFADVPLGYGNLSGDALRQPIFLEGDAGVGKTEVARALSGLLGRRSLIRLQCYEGIDASQALYEWNYARQLLHIRAAEAAGRDVLDVEKTCYSRDYLIARPLLEALEYEGALPAVLLIDEIDRADDEFEAFCSKYSPTSR